MSKVKVGEKLERILKEEREKRSHTREHYKNIHRYYNRYMRARKNDSIVKNKEKKRKGKKRKKTLTNKILHLGKKRPLKLKER